ncbi:INO80 complex subunit Da isoform X2 [Gouania willdenowi]|uniref:INO80 complex subunit Da isoform X2 n=1 Tax=Gouania willdenowi TaxID=441366 RepID=UPI001054AB50|nr:INO80 complex subunit D isoform X2 [Gouania willdenowi]
MYEGKHIHFSEVDNKPLCSYSPKLCKQRRLNGYAFCIRHVLEDKTAPFKQCEYVAKYNSQRCTNPIPKSEDRRYCNSHLQVLGFIPKKERKKKHDALEEMRSRAQLESVALNITVPSLALKASNGLDELPPSPPCTRLLQLPDGELLDPFAFYEDDTDGEEMGTPRKANAIKKNFQSRLVLNQKLCHDTDLFQSAPEHFTPSPVPHVHPSSPLNTHLPRQQQPAGVLQLQQHTSGTSFSFPGQQQGLLCNPPQPQTVNFPPPGMPTNAAPSAALHSGPSLSRKTPFSASHLPVCCKDGGSNNQLHMVVMRPTAFSPSASCFARLQHLVQLCAKRHYEHGDLFPHLAQVFLQDWTGQRIVLMRIMMKRTEKDLHLFKIHGDHRMGWYQNTSIRSHPHAVAFNDEHLNVCRHRLEDDGGSSRRTRLQRICSYLQEKYKHMCRQERASIRQKRCRYAFRKALLHAASKNPDCAGQLIQELSGASRSSSGVAPAKRLSPDMGTCTGTTKGQSCSTRALPFTRHCFQHILLNRSQQLFASCTAKFADGQQCSIPVFDITHQTPLCEEHATKMDNFLRGDGNRRVQHQQQRKPRKKTKPPALTKKHKKKRRRGPRRPQKPIPPALPQGNLGMPSTSLAAVVASEASVRSPSTPDLSTDELPDDITDDMADIPNDLELNQEDFSDVLPRLPDDLQDFDLFEGKNGELLPTTEEAEELVRALQAMGSYPDSLVCLTSMGELAQAEGVDHRAMTVFPGPVQAGAMGDLLNSRMNTENFSSLELEDNLLQSTRDHFPPSHSSQPNNQPAGSCSSLTSPPPAAPPSTPSLLNQNAMTERTNGRTQQQSHVLAKSDVPSASSQGSHFSSEHVPPPYTDHISSPHTSSFQSDPPLLLEVPPSAVPGPPRSTWNNIPLSITDPTQFGTLMGSDSHHISTSLSTPPTTTTPSVTLQPMAVLSALNQSSLTGITTPPPPPPSSSSLPSSSHDILTSTQPKQQLPQFSAAFGHQLASHSGIPKDVQPSHSSTAPPAGFSIVSATAASANSVTPPFTQSK